MAVSRFVSCFLPECGRPRQLEGGSCGCWDGRSHRIRCIDGRGISCFHDLLSSADGPRTRFLTVFIRGFANLNNLLLYEFLMSEQVAFSADLKSEENESVTDFRRGCSTGVDIIPPDEKETFTCRLCVFRKRQRQKKKKKKEKERARKKMNQEYERLANDELEKMWKRNETEEA
ncbi:hypothetical protein PUN28_004927 [Cardiocondyla obscurior]|uniref:Uncharacterized protein n=1 Tax=Cardiocondyla obscurior TaxID=286306 RepID=A0AAW2GFW6_9HYME